MHNFSLLSEKSLETRLNWSQTSHFPISKLKKLIYNNIILEAPSTQAANDDDDMGVQQAFSEFDPITKRRLENPVRNKICKHVYEKNSVEQLLLQNPRLRLIYFQIQLCS